MDAPMVSLEDFEAHAQKVLPRNAFSYYITGANAQSTFHNNKQAFQRLRLRPRVLRDVSNVDMTTSILGERLQSPICISPTAMQKMAHHDGELATARAVSKAGMLMTLSSWSTTSIEDVAQSSPCPKWFHLSIYNDDNLVRQLIARAEKAGYKAIVLTIDEPKPGRRTLHVLHRIKLPAHLTLANFTDTTSSKPRVQIPSLLSAAGTWQYISWLKSLTKLPIIVKGILTKEDAELAVKHKVDGILVSNHGGRQLDTVPATIEALPEVVEAVAGGCEVYLDGGVRLGTDVFKALALGAKAVFIGRPVLWGLAYKGEEGVLDVLNLLKEELRLAMALMGCKNLGEISKEMVVHESHYCKI